MSKKTIILITFITTLVFITTVFLYNLNSDKEIMDLYVVVIDNNLVSPLSDQKLKYKEMYTDIEDKLNKGDILKITTNKNKIKEIYPPVLEVIKYEKVYDGK